MITLSRNELIEGGYAIKKPDVMQDIFLVIIIKRRIKRTRVKDDCSLRFLRSFDRFLEGNFGRFPSTRFPVIAIVANRNDIFLRRKFSKTMLQSSRVPIL